MATASTIAQKFAGEGLDLILGVATPTTQAVVKADTTTPIVFTAVTDPVGAGIVTDAKAPAANVTGVSDMLPVQPHLDLIKQIVPNVKTIGVLYNAGESNSVFLIKAEKAAAAKMGIKVIDATASNSSEVQAAAQSLVGRVDAISVLTDNTVVIGAREHHQDRRAEQDPAHRRRHRQRQAWRRRRLRVRLQGPGQAGRATRRRRS